MENLERFVSEFVANFEANFVRRLHSHALLELWTRSTNLMLLTHSLVFGLRSRLNNYVRPEAMRSRRPVSGDAKRSDTPEAFNYHSGGGAAPQY